MESCDFYLSIIIVLLLFIVVLCFVRPEGFNGGPSLETQRKMVDTALQNPHLFDSRRGSYMEASKLISGLDNVTYEDFRTMYNKGRFTPSHLYSAFTVNRS